MKGARMRPFLTAGEYESFREIWSAHEGDAAQVPVPTPAQALRDAWRSVADVRDPELVRVAVLDLHARMVQTLAGTLSAAAKLDLLHAYSDVFVVFLMFKLPRERRKELPYALHDRSQPKAYVASAHRYYEFLLDREEEMGSPDPQWGDLQNAVEVLALAWEALYFDGPEAE